MLRSWSVYLFVLLSAFAFGQRTDLRLKCTVRSWDKDSTITGISVLAKDTLDTSRVVQAVCKTSGRCRMKLPLDHIYRIDFKAGPAFVPEHLVVDLNGASIKQRKWGYDLRVKVELMPRAEKLDYTVCGMPLGFARFDAKQNQFTWDEQYTAGLELRYESLRIAYEDRKKLP